MRVLKATAEQQRDDDHVVEQIRTPFLLAPTTERRCKLIKVRDNLERNMIVVRAFPCPGSPGSRVAWMSREVGGGSGGGGKGNQSPSRRAS